MRVFLAAAISLDGFIGPAANMRSFEWTSKEDQQLIISLGKEADVIIMGSNTFDTFKIKRAPPGRRLIIYTTQPESVHGEGIETTQEDPKVLLLRLEREGVKNVIIEGGSSIYKQFIEADVIDDMYITIEPVLFGEGVPFMSGQALAKLTLIGKRMLNDSTILLHYAVENDPTEN